MDVPDSTDGNRPRPPKRRKIGLACEACRARKARCNGVKPQCGNCVQRLERCLYRISNTQIAEANDYIESLVGRISELEGVAQDLQNATSTTPVSQLQVQKTPEHTPNNILSGYASNVLNTRQPRRPSSTTQSMPSRVEDTSSPVDGMGGAAVIDTSLHASDKFYGSSSATSFMKQLFGMVPSADQSAHDANGNKEAVPSVHSGGASQRTCYSGEGDFSLMPRALSDHLINTYWDKVYHLYPFIHKTTFMEAYEHLWLPSSQCNSPQSPELGLGGSECSSISSSIFHCALNAMMVLGLQFSTPLLAERDRLTESLVLKARSHFTLDMFDQGSIEVVQTLLLLVQIFQFTTFPTRCWSTIGAACRLAQGLGLHISGKGAPEFLSLDSIELRNRIWHSCLILDMVVSMTLGRPVVLAYRVDFPLPNLVVLDQAAENARAQDLGDISELSFFIEAAKMYKTLARVLSEIYGQNDGRGFQSSLDDYGSFDRLIELDNELVRFVAQVPEPLKWSHRKFDAKEAPFLAQQRTVLNARYLHLLVLLYRPTFTQFCRAHCCDSQLSEVQGSAQGLPELSPADSFAYSIAIRCVNRTIDLIVLTNDFAATEATGAWWYNMYYTRTAAIVIFMAMVCPLVRDAVGFMALRTAWNHCRIVLLEKLPQVLTVRKCLQTLEGLHDHIFSSMEKRKGIHPTEMANGTNDMVSAYLPESVPRDEELSQLGDQWNSLFDHSAFNFSMIDFGASVF